MENLNHHLSRIFCYKVWVWIPVCITLFLFPVVASARQCPVPEERLNTAWQRAHEAYIREDCVRFIDAAARYYELVNHSTFSWDTLEIGRAYQYCMDLLDSALEERDRLRSENANLRQRLSAGGVATTSTYGLSIEKPSLRNSPPHSLP